MGFRASLYRLLYIVVIVTRTLLAHACSASLARWPSLASRLPFKPLSGPERLRVLFEDLGGTFIKFGQMLALQPDILSLEYCNALFNLLDRVAPFSYEAIVRTFEEELGQAPSEIFDSIEREPLATASVGQVHVAYLNDRKLAVKVQRPGVATDFAGDIYLISATIRLIKFLRLRFLYWMIEPMSEFVEWSGEELDYCHEARYMERLRRNARNNPQERIPEVLWKYTTRRILVVEFLEGVTVLDYLRALETGNELMLHRLSVAGFDPDQFASAIIDNFVNDTFQNGMFHADLHPANLLILPGNVVGFVDFGITAVLSKTTRQQLVALTYALASADLDGMCAPFFNVSTLDEGSDIEAFRQGLKKLEGKWYEREGRKLRLRVNTTTVMLDMIKLSRRTGIWPERDVVKYIRSSIAADGLITRFAPGFNLGRHLEMVCSRHLKWQAGRGLFTSEMLIGWASSNSHLLRDGVLRASNFIQRLATGELSAEVQRNEYHKAADVTLRLRTLQLAFIILASALMMNLTGARAQFGINLFTAEIMLIGSAALMLLRTMHRLRWGRSANYYQR